MLRGKATGVYGEVVYSELDYRARSHAPNAVLSTEVGSSQGEVGSGYLDGMVLLGWVIWMMNHFSGSVDKKILIHCSGTFDPQFSHFAIQGRRR